MKHLLLSLMLIAAFAVANAASGLFDGERPATESSMSCVAIGVPQNDQHVECFMLMAGRSGYFAKRIPLK